MNFCDKFKIKNCMIINNWDYKKNKNKKQTKPNQKKALWGVWILCFHHS